MKIAPKVSTNPLAQDVRLAPIAVPQWMVDAEINLQRTPEGRKTLIEDFRYARERGLLLGDWVLPEI